MIVNGHRPSSGHQLGLHHSDTLSANWGEHAAATGSDWRLTVDMLEKIVLVVLLAFLVYRLVPGAAEKPFNLVYLAAEINVIVLLAVRRTAKEISGRPLDWLVGFGGTFLPLLVAQTDSAGLPQGGFLVVVGFGIAVGAQLSLRRSFGVVAANRGVKTLGLYRGVRHPMYLGYLLTYSGFMLMNPSVWNVAIYAASTACQLWRIDAEERVLSADPAYLQFKDRVRYRLLPLVY